MSAKELWRKREIAKGLLYTTVPTAAPILLLKGHTREVETIPKCRAAEGWIATLLPACFKNSLMTTDFWLYQSSAWLFWILFYGLQSWAFWFVRSLQRMSVIDGKCTPRSAKRMGCSSYRLQGCVKKTLGTVSFGKSISLPWRRNSEVVTLKL